MTELLQPDTQADPRIGMVLQEKYRIIRLLGEGGMGAVYEAEHELIRKRVAVKCLHQQFANNAEIVGRFHREALATTQIGHDNIIEVTDMGRFPDGALFMVLEFLEGRDWAADIESEGAQPLGKVVKIVSQMCDALDAAHEKEIIHRDLKPENVFLIDRRGNPDFVKVLDFGISKFKDAGEKGMTQTGTTMGTPYYMSPEQAQARKDIDHRADIYSIGVMMFQALANQYPFDDDSYPMLVLKICTEPPPSLLRFRPDLPTEIDAIVMKLLSKNPGDRFASCGELKRALGPFAEVNTAPRIDSQAPKTANMASSVLSKSQNATVGAPIVVPAESQVALSSSGSKSGSKLWIGLLLGALLLGAAAVTAVVLLTQEKLPPPVTKSDTPQIVPDEVPKPELPALPPVTQPATIPVTITVDPSDAEIYLDDKRVLNPYDGQITIGEHSFRVERRGYKTIEINKLNISQPQKIKLKLKRGRGKDRSGTLGVKKSAETKPAETKPTEVATKQTSMDRVVTYKDPRVDKALETAEQARLEAIRLRELQEKMNKVPEVVVPRSEKVKRELKDIF